MADTTNQSSGIEDTLSQSGNYLFSELVLQGGGCRREKDHTRMGLETAGGMDPSRVNREGEEDICSSSSENKGDDERGGSVVDYFDGLNVSSNLDFILNNFNVNDFIENIPLLENGNTRGKRARVDGTI